MRSLLILIGMMVLGTSCVHTPGLEDEVEAAKEGMAGWIIPDGFNYDMSPSQEIQVSFGSSGSRSQSDEVLQYALIGADQQEQVYGLQTGFAALSEGINLSLDIPMHIEEVYLYTKYQGNSRYFDVSGGALSLQEEDLVVSDDFFTSAEGRTGSTPACTSFLGNATQIRCRADGISIKSSASISFIDLQHTDGAMTRTTPEEQSVNANDNQWFFPYADFDVNQISSFRVIADCRTSPRTISTELVTFVNPCASSSVDSDNDGVDDDSDVAPLDPDVAALSYLPAYDTYSTFAFEDLWPYLGDFDFNDLVVAHNATVYANAAGMVSKVSYRLSIEAVGATFDNDLCLSFSDPGGSIGITLDNMENAGIAYTLHKIEGATEIRFKHFKEAFNFGGFINTDSTRAYQEPIQLSFDVYFDGSVATADFEIDEYLRINQEEGREVHKPGRKYTSLFDESLVGQGADDTQAGAGKYFLTENNLPWVIEIPIAWEHPKEKVEISKAYPYFKDFAEGRSNSPWYTDEEGNKVHKHLYKK